MGKFKKNKTNRDDNPNQLSTQELEQRSQNDLAQKNFRRAKEWLKELCRRDKDKYLPLLIECYHGLAGQMMEKGQMSEAKTVLDQVRQLAGGKGGTNSRAEALFALSSGDYKKAAEAMIGRYRDRSNPLCAGEAELMADTLVIAFEDIPGLRELDPRLCEELTAVRRGLECVCAGRFADALDEMKPVGMGSPFAGWRLFVKGLCAFYGREDSKAREAFQRLENRALLSRAARPFMFIIDEGAPLLSREEPKEPFLTQVLKILDSPGMEHVLPRAEYLWRLGRHADSYEHMARTLTGFPTEEPGLTGALSRFYFNAPFHMEFRQAEKYLKGIHPVLKKAPDKDRLLFLRMRNTFIDGDEDAREDEIMAYWEEFLTTYQRVHGENRELNALAYAHLGDIFAREVEDYGGEPFRWLQRSRKRKVEVRDYGRAEKAYQKSLSFNSADKEVHLSLLDLYEKMGVEGKRNKKLDEISRLWPDDKVVLAKNGNLCIERKAFLKGVDYLKKAAALDPLDRNVRSDLCVACIKASLHFARKGSAGRYRELMKDAIALSQPDTEDMTVGRRYLEVRQGLFEWIAGHDEEGARIFEDVMRKGGVPEHLTYFAWLTGRTYGVPRPHLVRFEKEVEVIFRNPLPALAAAFTGIITYVERIDMPKPWIYRELDLLDAFAVKAADKPCTPLEAEKIVHYALDRRTKGVKLGRTYIRKVLKTDPRNPLFLFFDHIYTHDIESDFRSPTRDEPQRLEEIRAIAIERGERVLIDILDKRIREVESFFAEPPYDGDYEDDDDVEDEEFWGYEEEDEDDMCIDPVKIMENLKKLENMAKKRGPRQKRRDPRQPSLFDDID